MDATIDDGTAMAARAVPSPDNHGAGLTRAPLEALRYDGHTDDPYEVAGMMRALMPSGVRVLDVGCGAGGVTLIANDGKGNMVRAIEPDRERAAAARARGIDVHDGYLDAAYIADHDPFDVIMSSDVLEHLPAPADALALFARALRPGGTLLLSVPNVAHWSVRANLLIGRFEYEAIGIMDATHLRWFTARSLARLLYAAGFDIVAMKHTSGAQLPLYRKRLFRYLPRGATTRGVHALTRALPRLFGAQHVVHARLRG